MGQDGVPAFNLNSFHQKKLDSMLGTRRGASLQLEFVSPKKGGFEAWDKTGCQPSTCIRLNIISWIRCLGQDGVPAFNLYSSNQKKSDSRLGTRRGASHPLVIVSPKKLDSKLGIRRGARPRLVFASPKKVGFKAWDRTGCPPSTCNCFTEKVGFKAWYKTG